MLDYQRIVDDVRSSLYSHSPEGMDFLRAAAADYSVACDEVNERLRQCGTLLRQGLRSEAIQLAEIDPNLLEVVAILDFPERDQWAELAAGNGIAPPRPLMLEVAAELNEAYAVEQPLASLLQQHRLLALAHGSLPARITVLRQLAEMDANNPVWQEDLRTFEEERQKQIRAEVEAAARSGDLQTITSLDAELSSPEWKNPPSPALVRAAADAKRTMDYWAVQSQLEDVAAELTSAMSDGRMDLAKPLHRRWQEIIGNSGVPPYEQLAQRAAPALKWVQARLDQETAVKTLADAIRNERSAARLQEVLRRAAKFGKLPTDLEERYDARLEALTQARKRHRRLGIAGAFVGCLTVILIIGWIVSTQRFEREVAAARENLLSLIECGEFEQAETLAEGFPPPVKEDARLQEQLALLGEKLKRETARQVEFAQRLEAARRKVDRVLRLLGDKPGQSVLDQIGQDLAGIESELAHARRLARTEGDRAEAAAGEKSATEVKAKWQSQLDAVLLNRCDEFDKQLAQIERDRQPGHQEQKTRIADYKRSLRNWESSRGSIDRALVTRIRAIDDRLSTLEKSLQRQEQEDRDEKQITLAVGDLQRYMKALQEFVQRNPDSPRSAGLKRVAEESPCWHALAEWQKVAAQWRQGGLAAIRPAAAEELVASAKTASESFAECVECESLRKVLPYLKSLAQRYNGGERIDAPLKKLFSDPIVAKAWMVETIEVGLDGEELKGNRQRYYFRERPKLGLDSPERTTFAYVSSFDGSTRSGWLRERNRVKYVGPAPQTVVAQQVLLLLKGLTDDNWEESFCHMVRVIHADYAIDPILKIDLYKQVLETGTRGSHCLEKAFRSHLAWIEEAGVDVFTNWLDPGIATGSNPAERNEAVKVANQRKDAEEKLESLPDCEPPINAVEQDLRAHPRLAEFRWVGWLRNSRDGQWECSMNSEPEVGGGSLFVACRRPTDGKFVLQAVGQWNHKVAAIDAMATSGLAEGRPVYLKVP